MIQGLEVGKSITPQDMHQKVMMQDLMSYDKDSKVGLSKTELNNYIMDKEFAGAEVPEFAKKLAEKFAEIDQNKDGMVSEAEVAALTNNRGIWSISPMTVSQLPQAANNVQATSSSVGLLQNNLSGLVQKGINYMKNNPQMVSKIQDAVHKFI